MLAPAEFGRAVATMGTLATVSDPHEIANVLGEAGIDFMHHSARSSPISILFGVPSCVPATGFETAGAELDAEVVARLLAEPRHGYLSELMNFPGVLNGDPEVLAKIAAAQRYNKPIDGHCPGLRGEDLQRYIDAGITTDHEAFTFEEGLDKLQRGMYLLIREGSAAKNFEALIDLLARFPERIMFCTDDSHPNDLLEGHINRIVKRALDRGLALWDILTAACVTPVRYYKLDLGLLALGDSADLILVESLQQMRIKQAFSAGVCVADDGAPQTPYTDSEHPNQFVAPDLSPAQFNLSVSGKQARVIRARDGMLVTESISLPTPRSGKRIVVDLTNDLCLLTVVSRYQSAPPALALVQGFGLKHGAIASSVAHDCHNLIAVGTSLEDLIAALTLITDSRGGLAVVGPSTRQVLPLPIAGLMTNSDYATTGAQYAKLDAAARGLGSTLRAPFMTLSFMALLVIPELKLSDRGLFDGRRFEFVKWVA